MAIYAQNSFEAGVASGTAISTANSGGSAGRAFDQFTTTEVYDSTQVAHGTLSAKFTQSASTSAQARWVDATNTAGTAYARWYMYITAAPAASTRVMHFALANGTQELAVRLKTDRHMDLLDSASVVMATSTTVIPTGQWVRFEAKMVPSTTVGQGELKIFTTPDSTTATETLTSTAAWNTGPAGSGMWRWGPTTGAAATYTLWLDDVAVAFDSYIGPSIDARSGSGTATAAASTTGTGSKRSTGSGSASLTTGTSDGGTKATTGTGAVASAATLAATGTHTGAGAGASGAVTTLAGMGGKALNGPVGLTAVSGLASSGAKRALGAAALTATTGLGSAGTARRLGVGQLAATVTLTGSGISGHQDLAHLSGTARVVAYSGTARVVGLSGTATVQRYSGTAEV